MLSGKVACCLFKLDVDCYKVAYQEMVYCCGSTFTIKLKTIGLLFLVAQRDFQRSQAEIFATDRKFFGTTIKSHCRVLKLHVDC